MGIEIKQVRTAVLGVLLCVVPLAVLAIFLPVVETCSDSEWLDNTPTSCAGDATQVYDECVVTAFVQLESITYVYYFIIELCFNIAYAQYNIIWLMGGYYVKGWLEFVYHLIFWLPGYGFFLNFLHFQMFPFWKSILPFLEDQSVGMLIPFLLANMFTVAYCLIRGDTEDQRRRAFLAPIISLPFLTCDAFMRSLFLPLFDVLQASLLAAHTADYISFIAELALTSFYTSIFLPATLKFTMVIVQGCLDVSFGRLTPLPKKHLDFKNNSLNSISTHSLESEKLDNLSIEDDTVPVSAASSQHYVIETDLYKPESNRNVNKSNIQDIQEICENNEINENNDIHEKNENSEINDINDNISILDDQPTLNSSDLKSFQYNPDNLQMSPQNSSQNSRQNSRPNSELNSIQNSRPNSELNSRQNSRPNSEVNSRQNSRPNSGLNSKRVSRQNSGQNTDRNGIPIPHPTSGIVSHVVSTHIIYEKHDGVYREDDYKHGNAEEIAQNIGKYIESSKHCTIRNYVPEPTRFMMREKSTAWMNVLWDCWRFLLIRLVLLQSSFLILFLLMTIKDAFYHIWHFGLRFTEEFILLSLELAHPEGDHAIHTSVGSAISWAEAVAIRPFFMPKMLVTAVMRQDFIPNDAFRKLSYDFGKTGKFCVDGWRRLADRRPYAIEKAKTQGAVEKIMLAVWWFLKGLFVDCWCRCNVFCAKFCTNFTQWLLHVNIADIIFGQKRGIRDQTLVFVYANEAVKIQNMPEIIPRSSLAPDLTDDEVQQHVDSIIQSGKASRGINKQYPLWSRAVSLELQNLIFNKTWPRVFLKVLSSIILFVCEFSVKYSVVGTLPSFQDFGFSRTADGVARLCVMVAMDVVELCALWQIQRRSPHYKQLKQNFSNYLSLGSIILLFGNAAGIACTSAILRYLRFAPACGDRSLYPPTHPPPMTGQFQFRLT